MIRASIAAHLRRLADLIDRPACPAWQALPGNRLELGATGYWIELKPSDPRADLFLHNPEGLEIWTGREWMLDTLKEKAEECARQRGEFAVKIDAAARRWRA